MLGRYAKNCRVIRVPDKPTAADLLALGNANTSYDETKNGLLVLDECGTWFNARNWQDKTRGAVNDWMLHARKLGWDVILIVQDIKLVDSQAREALAEHTVFCRRVDTLHVPFFGTLYKLLTFGQKLRLPRIHIARVVYGSSETDPLSDRWVYRGNDLFACYDTKQAFLTDYPHGLYSMLPPWHTSGRYAVPHDAGFYMRMTKIYWKRFKSPFAAFAGMVAGAALAASLAFAGERIQSPPAAAAQSVPAAAPVVEEKPSAEEPSVDPMIDKLRRFRIVASVEFGNRYYYEFSHSKRGEEVGPLVSSRELSLAGVKVARMSECHAVLIYQHAEYPVYCF
jgi:hypothetical protein